jgi:hypothetical protein
MARSWALACSLKATRLAILRLAVEGFVERGLGHGLPVCHAEPKIGEDFLHREGLVVLAPLVGFGDGFPVFLREGFIVQRGQGELARERVEHGLQNRFEGSQLYRRQLIDQAVNVRTGVGVSWCLLCGPCDEVEKSLNF